MSAIWFKLNEKCDICGKEERVGSTNSVRYWLLAGAHRGSTLQVITHRKREYIVGVKCNGKKICLGCFEILLGLEEYYDAFYFQLIDNPEVKKIIKNIYSNEEIRKKVFSYRYRNKRGYIPKEIIEQMKENGGISR